MQIHKTAILSDCRIYRYSLWRVWNQFEQYAVFIGLNPSTADETEDDPTIRRCIDFSQRWGFGGLCMLNLFAYRATDPEVMKAAVDPVGPRNDEFISNLTTEESGCGLIVAAWGKHGSHRNRDVQVMYAVDGLKCLYRNKDRSPKHPLYIKSTLTPFPMKSVGRHL